MGKGKKNKSKSSYKGSASNPSDDEHDDTHSTLSASTSYSLTEKSDHDIENEDIPLTTTDKIRDAITDLSEKRNSTRKEALNSLIDYLSNGYEIHSLDKFTDTILSNLNNCLAKGDSTEVSLTCQVLSLLFITVGLSEEIALDDFLVEKALDALEKYAVPPTTASNPSNQKHDDSSSTMARCSCLSTWMLYRFIHDPVSELIRSDGTLNYVQDHFWSFKNENLLNEAIKGWAFLASQVPKQSLYEILYPQVKKKLYNTLEEYEGVDIRITVGECFALLFEAKYFIAEETGSETFNGEDNQIVDIINEISKANNKSINKNKRSKQRSSYKEISATVEFGDEPEIKITIAKEKLTFYEWSKVLQYKNINDHFKGGMYHHFKENSLIKNIFEVQFVDFEESNKRKLTSAEKKVLYSKNSKYNKQDTIRKSKLTRQFGGVVSDF